MTDKAAGPGLWRFCLHAALLLDKPIEKERSLGPKEDTILLAIVVRATASLRENHKYKMLILKR